MFKWLKIAGIMVLVGLLAAVFASVALAQGPDADGDGVRDLAGSGLLVGRGQAIGFVDEDGDGVSDRYSANPEFVDEDGDGLCDVHGTTPGQGIRDNTGANQGVRFNHAPMGRGSRMVGN